VIVNTRRRKLESIWLTGAVGVAVIETGVYSHRTWLMACGIAVTLGSVVAFLLSLRSARKS
jgi:hypothetical protein